MTDPAEDITHLANALKAPRIRAHATRLADQAHTDGWSYEEYLAAVLGREVSAGDASGANMQIRYAGFPTRKSIEDFSPRRNADQVACSDSSGVVDALVCSIAPQCRRHSKYQR